MLKSGHVLAALGMAVLLPATSLFANVGFFNNYTIVNSSINGNQYYGMISAVNPLSGANLGTYTIGTDTLVLNGAQFHTFQNGTDDVTYTTALNYEVYKVGNTPPGSFSTISPIAFVSQAGNNDKTWETNNAGINLLALANLGPGTYDLNVYGQANDNYNGGSLTLYDTNNNSSFGGGPNYIATFTIAAPEPASIGLLGVGAIGLLTRRRRRGA